MTVQSDSPKSFVAGEALTAFMRVKLSGRNAWLADASDYGVGVTQEIAAITNNVDVRMYNHGGTLKMVASAAITAGDLVYAAASGKIAATGTLVIGTALDTATGDASIIEVLPHVSIAQSSSSSSSSSSS